MKKLALLLALTVALSCFYVSTAAVSVTTTRAERFDDEFRLLAEVEYSRVNVDAEKYPQLQKVLAELGQPEDGVLETLEQLAAENETYNTAYYDDAAFRECRTMTPTRFDDAVFSLRSDYEGYTGGAHGYYGAAGYNFDPVTGSALTITDVITDWQAWMALVQDKLFAEYEGELFGAEEVQETLKGYKEENCEWFLDGIGLHLLFNPYEVASYASGILELVFPYNEYPELFNAKYTALPERFIAPVSIGSSFPAKIGGKMEPVIVNTVFDENWEIHSLNVTAGEGRFTIPLASFYGLKLYLVTAENGSRLYAFECMDNDYPLLYILDLSDGSAAEYNFRQAWSAGDWSEDGGLCQHTATEESFLDPDLLKLEVPMHALSTVNGWKDCRIDENALLVVSEEAYRIGGDIRFTTLQPMNAEVEGETVELPAGTELKYLCTDGESWAELSLPDGRIAKVTIQVSGWPQYISGLELEDALEGTRFAG